MTEKSVSHRSLRSKNILTGSGAWKMQSSHYSEVYNYVLACNASNMESRKGSAWHQTCSDIRGGRSLLYSALDTLL